jgi:predicted nucleotidyltransferase
MVTHTPPGSACGAAVARCSSPSSTGYEFQRAPHSSAEVLDVASLTTTIVPGRPAPPSTEELRRLAGRIRAAATARGIQQVRVVGSVARGTARAESDVDLMVTVSPALKGARYFAALDEFREACVGIVRRSVDVIDQAGVQDLGTRMRLLREARVL